MKTSRPLVTIGLPVYNGLPHLETALKTLLAQDYENIELLISDNASSDATGELCQAAARLHPHVRYHRNAENIGPVANFLAVLAKARGTYFMWAAHDDHWNEQFVSALVETLESDPAAVLATPAVIHTNEDGTFRNDPIDRPAPGEVGLGNLKTLFADHTASWIYGLYRIEWLREHQHELNDYPLWGGDVMWLADACLQYPIVGNQNALLFKRLRRSGFAPMTARAAVAFWAQMYWYLSKICWRRTQRLKAKTAAVLLAWGYVYRLCIKRPNLLRTAWRVVRMLSLAAITSIPAGIAALWRRLFPAPKPQLRVAISSSSDDRRAAA